TNTTFAMKFNFKILFCGILSALFLFSCQTPNPITPPPPDNGPDTTNVDTTTNEVIRIEIDTIFTGVTATEPAAITLDGVYRWADYNIFYLDFLKIEFSNGHLEGRSISNVFSIDYIISGNEVLITHLKATLFQEYANKAKELISIITGNFHVEKNGTLLTLSRDGYSIKFKPEDEFPSYPNEFRDMIADTSYYTNYAGPYFNSFYPVYLCFRTLEGVTKEEVISLLNKYQVPADTAQNAMILGYNKKNITIFNLPYTMEEYCNILIALNQEKDIVEQAIPTYNEHDVCKQYFNNIEVFGKEGVREKAEQVLQKNRFYKYTIEQPSNSDHFKIKVNRDSLITGWEYFELVWILANCRYYMNDVTHMDPEERNFGWGCLP
ncbi:MAG: hypothetical protein Q4D14_05165, partial [Bacteroidales bacterium]|nr:hypothetical protein [Bacteroidales bacterium]